MAIKTENFFPSKDLEEFTFFAKFQSLLDHKNFIEFLNKHKIQLELEEPNEAKGSGSEEGEYDILGLWTIVVLAPPSQIPLITGSSWFEKELFPKPQL
jgi:hypothetical protein